MLIALIASVVLNVILFAKFATWKRKAYVVGTYFGQRLDVAFTMAWLATQKPREEVHQHIEAIVGLDPQLHEEMVEKFVGAAKSTAKRIGFF